MPSFTLELWRVLDGKAASKTEDQEIGLDLYPIFDETYRDGLNAKIKNHFMYREIGQETVTQFTFMLKRKMNEIMPYYNQLYKSQQITFDPLATIDLHSVIHGTGSADTTTTNTSSNSTQVGSTAKAVASVFPQVMLAPDKDYASSGNDSNSQTSTTGNQSDNATANVASTNDNTTDTTGYQGVASELLMSYRASLLNIDMMVIGDLEPLFMQIWNTDDGYTTRQGSPYGFGTGYGYHGFY